MLSNRVLFVFVLRFVTFKPLTASKKNSDLVKEMVACENLIFYIFVLTEGEGGRHPRESAFSYLGGWDCEISFD